MNAGRTCVQGRVYIGTNKKAGLVLMGGMLTMPHYHYHLIGTTNNPIILIVTACVKGQEEVLSDSKKILYSSP